MLRIIPHIMFQDRSYKISLLCAIALHVVLGLFLGIKLSVMHESSGVQQTMDIVQAFAVNQSVVDNAMTKVATTTKPKVEPHPIEEQPPAQQETKETKDNMVQQQQKVAALLKQHMQEEQAKELELLQKEGEIKQQELATKKKAQEKKQQEKLALQDMLHRELATEGKKLQQKQRELHSAIAVTEQAAVESNVSAKKSENITNSPAGSSSAAAREIDKYKTLLIQAIAQEWIVPDNVDKNESCKLLIKLAPGGVVLSVQVLEASSNPALDHSAQTAIWKASPLPVPSAKDLFDDFRTIQLTVRPQEIVAG